VGETYSKTQLPMTGNGRGRNEGEAAFQRGLEFGREYAGTAIRRIGAWAEENPGQLLIAGLAAGMLLGKLLFPRRRPIIEELD
jgi:hypothetical protein